MLHNIEALKKAQAAAMAEAEEANRIFLALPVTPVRVGFANTTLPWVTYEVATLQEALEVFKAYTPLPYVIARDGACTIVDLWAEIERKYNSKRADGRHYKIDHYIDRAPSFDCQAGSGFRSVEMEFYTEAADRTLKIIVRIAASPIQVTLLVMDAYSRTPREKYRKSYPEVPGARCIKWGYGEDCCKGTYWFRDLDTFWASMTTFGWNG